MSVTRKYPAKVITIKNEIDEIFTVDFESLGKPFRYECGQFLHLAIDEYDTSEQWPESRCFSIQSNPDEKKLRITFAVIGQFTKRLKTELKPGKEVTLKLPYGNLFLQEHNTVNTVFIAGGTGITPFLSLFTNASFAGYTNPVLFAGFRSRRFNLYTAELAEAQRINPGLKLHLFYQDIDGLLDIEKIYLQNNKESTYFISGPPEMIKIFKAYLLGENISENQIKTDDWE